MKTETEIKIRKFKESNYKGIYLNGKTLRLALDPSKPITELKYPEFYDVKITNKCSGNCPYCYQDSKQNDVHYKHILSKTVMFFHPMNTNQRPFQVALGGGNPNEHPAFIQLLKTYDALGITPNYTTNGIGLTKEILEATEKYCGGIAISCHPHLTTIWKEAVQNIKKYDIVINLHLIISDKESIQDFVKIFKEFKNDVEYFVLLPYETQGRATKKEIEYELLDKTLEMLNSKQIAFGANFYEFLKVYGKKFDVSLYEPEIMSKYLDMKDMSIHQSSFNLNT